VCTGFLFPSSTSSLTQVELFGIFSRISSQTDTTAITVAEALIQQEPLQATRTAEVKVLVRQQNIKFIEAMLTLNAYAASIAPATELPIAQVNAIIDEIKNTGAV
jgi:hypothetical protein